jgi:selenocysteine-specific elongation factor
LFVIGTAGHVDHGKSTLVRALTGINPDRLREEQERQMTIDLGFAWMTLPSGREISIVDVPGHEDFIKNMLAGIGNVDVALLVIAADEAVMPQTREHLAILDLLQIPRGVVALTKCDLVQDPEWLELVIEEVREELQGTVLQDVTIIPVSAVTSVGLEDLTRELDRLLDGAEPRPDIGQPRLPIDRAFTIAGFGTVVTGTLLDGSMSVGDEVAILPGGLSARVRGLQTHKTQERQAEPWTRVAVNLTGVSVDQLQRGMVLARPGKMQATTLVDARFRLLPNAPWPLKHNTVVDLYSGTARVESRIRLLDADELAPGAEGWVQFSLSEPMVVRRGDRYIARLPSPSLTLGGGQIVQAHPGRRHRRFRAEVIAYLETLSRGTPEEILLQLLQRHKALEWRDALRDAHLPEAEAIGALRALVGGGQVLLLGAKASLLPDGPPPQGAWGVVAASSWQQLLAEIVQTLVAYHQRFPLREGMPREELKSRVGLDGALFSQALEYAAQEGRLVATTTSVRLAEHRPALTAEQERKVAQVRRMFRDAPSMPPSQGQVEELLGADVLQYVLDQGDLIKVSEGVLFDAQTVSDMERRVVAFLQEHSESTVAQVRDLLGTSRKYALAFLEDLDRRHVTKRIGDMRVLR